MADELELETKDDLPPTNLGDTTNLPGNFNSFQESLWETISFQRNLNLPVGLGKNGALGLALAIQCSSIKARDIAKSEMELWRREGRQYVRVEPNAHWFARMLARRPNVYHSWAEFWRMVVTHYALAQNAYVYKEMSRDGTITALIPLAPAKVKQAANAVTGSIFYDIDVSTEHERAVLKTTQAIRVPASRIIHLRGRMYDGAQGLSNLKLGDPLFDLIGAISRYQAGLFTNDGRLPLVFESDTAVFGEGDQADAAFKRLKDQLSEAVRKMNRYGDPILLEAGYKAKVVAQNAREAMTKEAFDQAVLRMCSLMEMPPSKIYALESVKYDNQAELNAQYANDILIPIANDIRDKFKLSLFTPDEWEVFSPEFDQLALMAGDPKTLIDIIDKAMKSGLMTFDEGRERLPLGLNPYAKGGDRRMFPVGFALVDPNGQIIELGNNGQANNNGGGAQPNKPANSRATSVLDVKSD